MFEYFPSAFLATDVQEVAPVSHIRFTINSSITDIVIRDNSGQIVVVPNPRAIYHGKTGTTVASHDASKTQRSIREIVSYVDSDGVSYNF